MPAAELPAIPPLEAAPEPPSGSLGGAAHGQVAVVAVVLPLAADPGCPVSGPVPSAPVPAVLHGQVVALVAGGPEIGAGATVEACGGFTSLLFAPALDPGVVPGFVLGTELVLAPD